MRTNRRLLVAVCSLVLPFATVAGWSVLAACGGGANNGNHQCNDGKDNDGDGLIDFPDDPGCTSPTDDSENSPPSPQCSDGRDNDGDGLIDYPNDPGCFSPLQDDETDDCPNGPSCPQCANGKDDDGNGLIDYPNDPGCTAAGDTEEFTENPVACGPMMMIKQLPATGTDTGMFDSTSTIAMVSPCGGGGGGGILGIAYELHLPMPKVITATTAGSTTDTVIDIRSANCAAMTGEVKCNDNVSATDNSSSVTASLAAGTYFIIVESHNGDASAMYTLTVQQFAGAGTPCTDVSQCGPGLLCQVPQGGTTMQCSNPFCSDGVDNDGDGKIDYPNDPGCTDPSDNTETDDCPSGPMCPQCSNGIDDDMDGKTDYPMDPSCQSASSNSEFCTTHENVAPLLSGTTMGDTTNAVDDYMVTCAFGTGGKDLFYELDVPALTSLSVTVADPTSTFFPDYALLGKTCAAPELGCQSFSPITLTGVAAGSYFLVVDGDDSTQAGPFTITLSGTIAGGQSCESPLATSGALTCAAGYICKGAAGARTCAPTQCNDGIDNNGDGKKDYPNDPGCSSPSDDTETTVCPGAMCPVCSNGVDDDSDTKIDFPADFGCSSAAGASEVFCSTETDPVASIAAPTTSGTLAALHHDHTLDCQANTGFDKTYVLQLPVNLNSLVIDTKLSTITDTVLQFWDTQCTAPAIACDDDGGGGLLSSITLANVSAGNYAVTVAGYSSSNNGAFKLNVKGKAGSGAACNGALFTAGVLACDTGLTCTANKCQ